MNLPGFRPITGVRTVLLSSLLAAGALGWSPAPAQQRGPVQRIVHGKVTDKADAPIKGAVVYIKDDHTLSVKSFISDDAGGYRFGQLQQNTDYEIWAEHEGNKSGTKNISSFDTKNDLTINLKVDTGK